MTDLTAAHALDRLAAWQLAMHAENKSPATIACYTDATTRYLRWCTDGDHPPMSRNALNDWISGMLAAGAAPGTARTRQLAVRRLARWLTEGGDLPVLTQPAPSPTTPRRGRARQFPPPSPRRGDHPLDAGDRHPLR